MESTPAPAKGQIFSKVAECLYRNDASGTYYALVKGSGKQIHRSLKTNDRENERIYHEARRRLNP